MLWQGQKIQELLKEHKITKSKLANDLNITRPTINEWIKGKIPKGLHLLAICKYFNLNPNDLFSINHDQLISIPQHRMRRTAIQTEETDKLSHELASDYLSIFRNYNKSQLIQNYRDQNLSKQSAVELAEILRKMIDLDEKTPIDYKHTFKLLNDLSIFTIFRKFPENIKSYAFNCEISNKRVLFINTTTNILDLVFPILHEVIHLIKENKKQLKEYDDIEEEYCDNVACYIQFPESYVDFVYASIENIPTDGQKINVVKEYSSSYGHVGYGLIKRIQEKHPGFKLNISPADTNLKKDFPSIGELIFEEHNPRMFIDTINKLSPLFIDLILDQLDILSARKINELLGIENTIDAISVREELVMLKKQRS